MQVLIFGGSGFVGQHVARHLLQRGFDVHIASRTEKPVRFGTLVRYQTDDLLALLAEMGENYAVINLAGESLNAGRWTHARKQRLLHSRLQLTEALASAIAQADTKPQALVNASAVGYYGYSESRRFSEADQAGTGFLADVTKAWEASAARASADTRVVLARLGVVLGADGGALTRMILPYRMFAGGRVGSGRQWLSWIHVSDVANLMEQCLLNPAWQGAVNFTAPAPVTMEEFGKTAGHVLHRPHWLPVPAFALELLLGEMAEIVLQGQYVLPQKALDLGFSFQFPTLESALKDILAQP